MAVGGCGRENCSCCDQKESRKRRGPGTHNPLHCPPPRHHQQSEVEGEQKGAGEVKVPPLSNSATWGRGGGEMLSIQTIQSSVIARRPTVESILTPQFLHSFTIEGHWRCFLFLFLLTFACRFL